MAEDEPLQPAVPMKKEEEAEGANVKMENEAKEKKDAHAQPAVPSEKEKTEETSEASEVKVTSETNAKMEEESSEAKVEDKPQEPEINPKALEVFNRFNTARKEFLSECESIAQSYNGVQSSGLIPQEIQTFVRGIVTDPDPEVVSHARRVSHLLHMLKNQHQQMYKRVLKSSKTSFKAGSENGPETFGTNGTLPTKTVWDGLFAVNKPKGWTSADVVRQVRSTVEKNMRQNGHRKMGRGPGVKVGHGGTLDPLAQGVLVIAIGSACRKLNDFLDGKKTYVADALMGVSTDTMDSEGKKEKEMDASHVTAEKFEEALKTFRGTIKQMPPMYSACKKNGVALYKMARKGKTVEREPREVTLYELKHVDKDEAKLPNFRISLECSKGLYVRVLVHDLGDKCGTVAHMTELTRTKQGKFTLSSCLNVDCLKDPQQIAQHLVWTRSNVEGSPQPPSDATVYKLYSNDSGDFRRNDNEGGKYKDCDGNMISKKKISEFKVGETIEGVVKGVTSFGAFIDVGGERDGLLHESKMLSKRGKIRQGDRLVVQVLVIEGDKIKLGLTDETRSTVCLGGLPKDISEELVSEKMGTYGNVVRVQMGGRLPDGVAYILFKNESEADQALQKPPTFDPESGQIKECKRLSDHLKERNKELLLVLDACNPEVKFPSIKKQFEEAYGPLKRVEFDRDRNRTYVLFARGGAARSAKENKDVTVEDVTFNILETTEDDVNAFTSIQQNRMDRYRDNRKRRGGYGRGGGRFGKRRRERR